MADLKAGDIVKLKSGGPLMTVQSFRDDKVCCAWFVNKELKDGWFGRDAVETTKPAERKPLSAIV